SGVICSPHPSEFANSRRHIILKFAAAAILLFVISAFAGIPYVAVPLSTITNSPPNGPWTFSTHASVTGYIIDWQLHANLDGDRHIVVCDSRNFVTTKSSMRPMCST